MIYDFASLFLFMSLFRTSAEKCVQKWTLSGRILQQKCILKLNAKRIAFYWCFEWKEIFLFRKEYDFMSSCIKVKHGNHWSVMNFRNCTAKFNLSIIYWLLLSKHQNNFHHFHKWALFDFPLSGLQRYLNAFPLD